MRVHGEMYHKWQARQSRNPIFPGALLWKENAFIAPEKVILKL